MKIAFTIVTSNYLAHAKTIADSFLFYNEDYKFIICLLDKINGRFTTAEFSPHEIVDVETISIPYFDEMYKRYDMFELSNALKPFFAEYLFENTNDLNILVYLDSDMMVFDSFHYVEECLKSSAICFTPHILTTIPKDDLLPDETAFLNSGIYNGGFFALSIGEEAKQFVHWWKEKLRYFCFHNVCEGQFVDQIWLNLVPIYFDKVCILRHVGYNVAYYNLHERVLSTSGDKIFVNQKSSLVLFHFTGYDIKKPELISKYQTRFDFSSRADIHPLYTLYRKRLEENRIEYFSNLIPYYKELREKKESLNEPITFQQYDNGKQSHSGFLKRLFQKSLFSALRRQIK